MATDISTAAPSSEVRRAGRRRLPPELSILGVMIGMMLLFEVLGWIFVGQSFIAKDVAEATVLRFLKRELRAN